jgi:biotin operon repressor
MTVRPNSQNARILRVLADGGWHSTAAIHRKAGSSRLNSRVSELRAQGYEIEHGRIDGKKGPLGHRYRLLNPPPATELARLIDPEVDPVALKAIGLDRDSIPRNSDHRYRIYRMVFDQLDLVATASDGPNLGEAILTLGREGWFRESCIGILDTHGTEDEPGEWLVNPFETSPIGGG